MKSRHDLSANQREPNREHLVKFAETFIRPEFRSRWVHILCDRSDKARDELHEFDRHVEQSVCRLLDPKSDRDATLLGRYGDAAGVYFDGKDAATPLRLSEVLDRMRPYQDDALVSLEPGRSAIFFHHDGMVLLCCATGSKSR